MVCLEFVFNSHISMFYDFDLYSLFVVVQKISETTHQNV